MSKNDQALLRPGDIAVALSLLTRLPMPGKVDFARGGHAAWAYPLAGLIVALIAGAAGITGHTAGLDATFSALITMIFLVVLTGAMHLDGLADTADGLWGGWDREKRLAIMKDSHIGTYGVIAIFFALSWYWSALFILFQGDVSTAFSTLLAAALLSRAVMPTLMATLPHARDTGLSRSVGRVSYATAAMAIAIATLGAIALLGSQAAAAIACAVVTTIIVAFVARRKIGGQTGDILGAAQVLAELAILTSLVP